MPETNLSHQLGALRAWKQTQLRLLEQLQPWLRQQGLYTAEARNAIERAQRALGEEHLTVAVAGEFSRGKTELINALFFADFGRRLLPTDAGRTTMCPTEIYSDARHPPQLRLLPIETRRDELSLAALKETEAHWEAFELALDDPDSLSTQLRKLTEFRKASKREAAELGLLEESDGQNTDQVSIPCWRLALINIPHPLLAQGLRILDTPGLNAIGSEPELTYEMLPAAHAILFVLAADAGVTRSDLQIWQRFVQRPGQQHRAGAMVVLNKTDTLWDEMRPPQQITETIIRQCREVAETLGVASRQVFAVSAQKALLARVHQDKALESRSGISSLENYLGGALMAKRMELIRQEHTHLVREAIAALEGIIRGRIERNEHQRLSLLDLADRSDSAIETMLAATQADYQQYQTSLKAYRQSLNAFQQHGRRLKTALNSGSLEVTLDEIRTSMTGAWTTLGLKEAMRRLFEDINSRLRTAGMQTQQMRRVLRAAHRRFQSEHRFKLAYPTMLSLVKYQVELSLLEQEADTFRKSARTTLMEQHFVTRRYFSTIVTRALRIIEAAHDEARLWGETALSPLSTEVKEYRDDLAQQMQDLKLAGESRSTIKQRIAALKRDSDRLHAQLASLGRVREMLGRPQTGHSAQASGQN